MVRERWMHLMLLGFALSIVVHVVIMLRLWAVKLPDREDNQSAAIELALQELPPAVGGIPKFWSGQMKLVLMMFLFHRKK